MRYVIVLFIVLGMLTSSFARDSQKITLRNKIGQMLIIGFDENSINSHSDVVRTIEENNIGGVILFDYNYKSATFERNIVNPSQVKELNKKLQYFTELGNIKHHRPNLPLLISVDYEGGKVNRLGEQYGFPKTFSAKEVSKKNLEEVEGIAQSMAETLKKSGFNLNFAPVVDVNINPESPIIGKRDRSFSADASSVTTYASIYGRHFLNEKVQCAYKHFPGHGSSTKDSHLGFVDVSDTWKTEELIPYKQLLEQDYVCGLIMTAHLVNRQLDPSGLPATLSHSILTDLLRNKLHYKGVVITDDMQMKAISEYYSLEQALVLAINAGADMFIFGNNLSATSQDPNQLIDIIEEKVRSGEISEQRIDQAYKRIVKLKRSLGDSSLN